MVFANYNLMYLNGNKLIKNRLNKVFEFKDKYFLIIPEVYYTCRAGRLGV